MNAQELEQSQQAFRYFRGIFEAVDSRRAITTFLHNCQIPMRDSDKFGNQSAMINNETYKYCTNIVLINFLQEDADVVSFFNQKSL